MRQEEISQIASVVRFQFEGGKVDLELLAQLYSDYNSVPDPARFVTHAQELFPRLNCGLASVLLQKKLQKGEIVRGRYKGNNHTFLLLDKKIVVDITADQYGGPRIYVGNLQFPWAL